MIFSLRIALKFHRGSSKNKLISLMSWISIFSISIGIAVSITALSVMHGFKHELNKRILSIVPHIEIKSADVSSCINWKEISVYIRKIPNVISVSPYINLSGIIQYRNKWRLVCIRSVDLEHCMYKNKLSYFLTNNHWKYFCRNKSQILVGKGIADDLNVKVGDWITILIASDVISNRTVLSSKKFFLQISGILNLNSQLDQNVAFISLLDAKYYSNTVLDAEGISIQVTDPFSINKIILKIKKILKKDMYMSNWMNTYGYIYRDIQIIRVIIYLLIILIMGIFCFTAITTLILSIKNKNYDIAVLKILGAPNVFIQYVFFWYGLILYIISSVLGMGLGILITLNLTKLSIQYNNFLERNIFSSGVYFVNFLPSRLNGWDVFYILITIIFLGILVSWYSSLKTKNFDVLKILK